MHHIIYLSRTTEKLSPLELVALLIQARRSNELAGITGAMVYSEGQFMQVIEGEQEALIALYARIMADPRHQTILKVADRPIAERTFLNWSMAFREISPEQAAELEGYLSPEYWEQTSFASDSTEALLLNHMLELVLLRDLPK
jgi:hypothetical protein